MSITSGRSLRFLPTPGPAWRTRLSAFRSSFDNGAAEGRSSSISISSSEALLSDAASCESLLFLRAGCCIAWRAHCGTGFSNSNCFLRRLLYSLPLTTSSASVLRSLRKRGTEASETIIRSSSLSSQAGGCFDRRESSSSADEGARTRSVAPVGSRSVTKSYTIISYRCNSTPCQDQTYICVV